MPFCRECGSPVQEGKKCPVCGTTERGAHALTPPGATEETLRFIFDSIADGIVVVDLKGNLIEVNETVLKLGGFSSKEEVLGLDGFSFVDEDSLHRLSEALAKVLRDGRAGPVEYTAQGKDADAFFGEAMATLLRDAAGEPMGIIAVIRDISERKKAERKLQKAHAELQKAHEQLKASEEQLIQSAKMAAVGQLVSGVAHEINNPLMAIAGYTEMLLKKTEDEPSGKRLQRIYDETSRAINIVHNLLSFARKQDSDKLPVPVNESIESAIQLRAYEMSLENIEIETNLAADLPDTMADFQQLQQIFLNLLINSEQAIKKAGESGKVSISTEQKGNNIRITFSDSGPGIPEEVQKRIFEPFFTTKKVGEGTGLGLSICYGIINDHGGNITVNSNKGEGTTFTIELPISTQSNENSS
ncbi:MAG: ATP-binding protein [Dehalococcoidia bacterium]